MKFVTYPTERDREMRRNGRLLEGQKISDAPPSGSWVLCPDEPAERRFHRVFGQAVHPSPDNPKLMLRSSLEKEAHR